MPHLARALSLIAILGVLVHVDRAIPAQTDTLMHAIGSFEVKTTPQDPPGGEDRSGRMALSKVYEGSLSGRGVGTMMTGGDFATGMAGYVAIETVTGTLDGKTGGFQLMHWGSMHGQAVELRVEVVPGSGSGALKGISGSMKISQLDGKHTYALDYSLPAN
jgi:hypothetical protein